jgi:hypothetical protein
MSKHITLNIFADPGHAWCRVAKNKLEKLGIANKISAYSYERGEYAYLEEDCDLATLIDALRTKGYVDIKFKTQDTNRQSKIRGYNRYTCPEVVEEYDPMEDFNYVGSRYHY